MDEKFYLNTEKAARLLDSLNRSYVSPGSADKIVKAGMSPGYRRVNTVIDPAGVVPTLAARDYKAPLRVLVGGSCIDDTQNFDDSPRVYEDTVPTLRAGRFGLMVLEDPTVRQVGNIVNTGNFDNPQRGRIYDSEGLCPTLNTMQGGGLEPKIIEPVCAASRGRNPTNPGDRTPGIDTVQRLEINGDGVCNTLTTVQKDNLVVEPSVLRYQRTEYAKQIRTAYENGEILERRCNLRELSLRSDGISNTLTTVQKDNLVFEPPFRIRKLTPRECWRLMGFLDSDFDRVKNISNAQLYKQAGNSICVPVLERIFIKLFEHENFRKILGMGD